ncbi:hypothetical protein KKP04_04565 [Rhodomicrobium sp. Az07]|uniref:hypothetical protein n=1 Tax=Rhodomicrobium sp. Az07 TaxID=2839034 RepID=UPI001BEBE239|nr:hypothetical protein [Rhodomicrobium sp. Az07]MBT3070141.1 hypothetical protein [Rhodomicrobium sp. Az07]
MRKIGVIMITFALGACATGGDTRLATGGTRTTSEPISAERVTAIEPAKVNHAPYMGFSCERLAGDKARISDDIAAVSAGKAGSQAADVKGQIARLKGEEIAVTTAMRSKKCK